jgi:hypothetical protein
VGGERLNGSDVDTFFDLATKPQRQRRLTLAASFQRKSHAVRLFLRSDGPSRSTKCLPTRLPVK